MLSSNSKVLSSSVHKMLLLSDTKILISTAVSPLLYKVNLSQLKILSSQRERERKRRGRKKQISSLPMSTA